MSEESNDNIDARMDRFGADRKSPSKPRTTPKFVIPALLLMTGAGVGVSAAAYLVNVNKQEVRPANMPETSSPGEWQSAGLDGLSTVDAPPSGLVTYRDNSEELAALQSTILDLEGELKRLRDNPEVKTVTDDAALDSLREELTAIRKDLADSQTSFDEQKALLEQRDRDIARLQGELETERLMRDQSAEERRLRLEEERKAQEEEARRRAELEARRAEAEALLHRKINSPIVAYSSSAGGSGTEDARERYTGDNAFRANAEPASVTQSEIIANPSNTVVQGTLIEGTLETGILSDLAGNVTAIVSYDVYSFDMSQVLIPRGSKLYGRYSSDVGIGQKRVLIAWDRIVTTDGQSVQIAAFGGDRLGRSGLPGKVDNHFFERFGTAALISVIGAVPALAANEAGDDVSQEVAENVADDFEDAVDDVLADYLSIPPTISVDQGAVVMVRVNNDLELF